VPVGWTIKALKHVFHVVGGSTPKSDVDTFWNGEYVWVTPGDLSGLSGFNIEDSARRITAAGLASCGTRLVSSGSLVLSTRAPIGSLAIAGTRLCTNQGCKSLIPKQQGETRFFAYLLSIASEELNVRGRGTTFLEISADALGAFEIVVPSSQEQAAIAGFLDHETAKIDALVEEQQRLIELLKEKRQAVISQVVTKGLDPTVPMKDSGVEWLGKVPAHWEVRKVNSLSTKITNGYVGPTRDILVDEGVRYLQSLHIKGNRIKFEVPYFVTETWSREHSKSILETGDLLIVQTGDIGQAAVVTDEFAGCNCHALIIVSPLREVVCGEFLGWVFNSDYGKHSLLAIQTGALHPHLNCGNVKDVFVPIPPFLEQLKIVESCGAATSAFDELMAEAEAAVALLNERRSALISAAVTGKIDVRGLVS
jgi:type I restriction enzyme S subunit